MNNRLQSRQDCCQKPETRTCGGCSSYDQLQMMPLAMAYVPWQQWQNVCEGGKGLAQGSIFDELILPFHHASRACGNMHACRTTDRYFPREHMEYREQDIPCQHRNQCERRCD